MQRGLRGWVVGGVAALALGGAASAGAQVTHGELVQRLPVAIGGRLWLDLYEPYDRFDATVLPRARMRLEGFSLTLDKDGEWGGMHVDLRARESAPRPFYPGNVWFEEAYGYTRFVDTKIKVGAITHLLGLPDDTGYGTIADHDGLKNDSDYGLAVEGVATYGDHVTVTRAIQYFISENRVNRAFADTLGLGLRDAESQRDMHEARGWLLRLSPEWTRGTLMLAPGLTVSTERLEQDFHYPLRRESHETVIWGGDLRLRAGDGMRTLRAEGEILGRNSAGWTRPAQTAFEVPNVRYTQAAAALGSDRAFVRYGYSHKTYRRGPDLRESQHQVAFSLPVGKKSSLGAEYVLYRIVASGVRTTLERALIVRLAAGF